MAVRNEAKPGTVIASASSTPMAMPPATVAGSECSRPMMAAANAGITRKVSSVACSRTMFASSRPHTPAKAPLSTQATVSTPSTRMPSSALRSRSLASARIFRPTRVFDSSRPTPPIISTASVSPSARVWVSRTSTSPSTKSMAPASVGSTSRRGCSPQYHAVKPTTTSATPSVAMLRRVGSRCESLGASNRP